MKITKWIQRNRSNRFNLLRHWGKNEMPQLINSLPELHSFYLFILNQQQKGKEIKSTWLHKPFGFKAFVADVGVLNYQRYKLQLNNDTHISESSLCWVSRHNNQPV